MNDHWVRLERVATPGAQEPKKLKSRKELTAREIEKKKNGKQEVHILQGCGLSNGLGGQGRVTPLLGESSEENMAIPRWSIHRLQTILGVLGDKATSSSNPVSLDTTYLHRKCHSLTTLPPDLLHVTVPTTICMMQCIIMMLLLFLG